MPKSERFRYFEEGTDPLVLLIYSLALRISLIKLSIAFFTTRPYSIDP